MLVMDPESLYEQGKSALAGRRYAEAGRAFRQLLLHVNVLDLEYNDWVRCLAECYRTQGRSREVLYLLIYLQQYTLARTHLTDADGPLLQARLDALQQQHLKAAKGFLAANCQVQAALAFERAHDLRSAQECWQ